MLCGPLDLLFFGRGRLLYSDLDLTGMTFGNKSRHTHVPLKTMSHLRLRVPDTHCMLYVHCGLGLGDETLDQEYHEHDTTFG